MNAIFCFLRRLRNPPWHLPCLPLDAFSAASSVLCAAPTLFDAVTASLVRPLTISARPQRPQRAILRLMHTSSRLQRATLRLMRTPPHLQRATLRLMRTPPRLQRATLRLPRVPSHPALQR